MSNYENVWRAAEPYMRARKNDVHVPLSFKMAERLTAVYPQCNPDVVLLAILLHDIGWATVDEQRIFNEGFGPNMMESDVRRQHELEGMRLARQILEELAYHPDLIDEVCAIIDGHDTRKEPLSLNDQLVKDADKLWRFTTTGISVICDWFKMNPAQYAYRIEQKILPQLFTDASRTLATEALAVARKKLKLDLLGESEYEILY